MTFSLFDLAFVGSLTGGAALWTPADITTALWLDAADASTITESSGAVSQWNDKSGNARHVAQSTEGNRPTFDAGSLNALDTILFTQTSTDSANIKELRNSSAYTAARGSVFLVIRPGSSQQLNGSVFCSRQQGLEGFRAAPSPNDQNTVTTNIAGSTGRINGTPVANFAPGGSFHTYLANEALLLGAVYPAAASISFLWASGRDPEVAPSRGFNGNVAEIVVMTEIGVTATHQRIEGYLAHKWGLTANLPNDHPYKTAAPTL
jgi:hypothetical protein